MSGSNTWWSEVIDWFDCCHYNHHDELQWENNDTNYIYYWLEKQEPMTNDKSSSEIQKCRKQTFWKVVIDKNCAVVLIIHQTDTHSRILTLLFSVGNQRCWSRKINVRVFRYFIAVSKTGEKKNREGLRKQFKLHQYFYCHVCECVCVSVSECALMNEQLMTVKPFAI